jgi:DNA replication protein DnaC
VLPRATTSRREGLAQLAWIEERCNVCFLGPRGTGKTHLAIALGLKACKRGHRVAFATAKDGSPGLSKRRTATNSSMSYAGSSATTY